MLGRRSHLGDRGLQVARDFGQSAMKLILERDQPSLGAVEPLLCGPRSGDADLRQARRVLAKLLDRLFVNLSESVPIVLNQRFDAPLHRLSILFGRFSESIQL